MATEVYLDMTFRGTYIHERTQTSFLHLCINHRFYVGSVSYLVTHETSTSWSHILMAQDGKLVLIKINISRSVAPILSFDR